MKKSYNEQHILFSRVSLDKDSPAYKDFYQKHPEYQVGDDAIRGMNFLDGLKKEKLFKQRFFPMFTNNEHIIKNLYQTLDEIPLGEKVPQKKDFHKNIKAITKHYGAIDVGIVKLNEGHYYTHHGNRNKLLGEEAYGKPITTRYQTAIVFLVPMAEDALKRSPYFESIAETQNAYLNMAFTGFRLASYLKTLGYRSMFQSEIHYLTPLVPLAYDAGLGEIGMTNHLLHPEYGNRIRIGAVMSDIALDEDNPIDFGLKMFCERCALCLINCPMQSISFKKRWVNDRLFYKFNDQSCFKIFKNAGTDCGVCIQSCPLSYGIGSSTLYQIKNDRLAIDTVIQKHLDELGRRPAIKHQLSIVEE